MNTEAMSSADALQRLAKISEQADAQKLAAYIQAQNPKQQISFDSLTERCQRFLKSLDTTNGTSIADELCGGWNTFRLTF